MYFKYKSLPRLKKLKVKTFCLILIIFILILIFCKFYVLNKSKNYVFNGDFMSQLNENGDNSYMDLKNYKKKFVDNMRYFKNFTDKELNAELKRRKKFDFYFKLKTISINNSLSKLIKSYVAKKEISYIDLHLNWQERIFGHSKPHIIKSINTRNSVQYPEIANGYLGIKCFSDEVQIQSVFSGSFLYTRRASIPAWTIRNITSVYSAKDENIVIGNRLELDMSDASFKQILYSDSCIVEQKIYAHQSLTSLIIHEIEVQFLIKSVPYVIIKLPKGVKMDISSNIQFQETLKDDNNIRFMAGITNKDDSKNHQQNIYAQFHVIPNEINVTQSEYVQKFYYLLSINEDQKLCESHFQSGITMMENRNELYRIHTSIWKNIWSTSGMIMKISDEIDISLISAQYLVMINSPSFGRMDQYGAIGATGLGVISNQGVGSSMGTNCNGRIEYTQELWMMGFLTVMNPESVKSILKKRIKQMPMAEKNSAKFGFKGIRFPAVTNEIGEELCPKHLCGNMHFPTGMVALTLKNYLLITGDSSLFTKEKGLEMLKQINNFLLSVLTDSMLENSKFNFISVGPSTLFTTVRNSIFNLGLVKEILNYISILTDYLEIKNPINSVTYMEHLKNMSSLIPISHHNKYQFHLPYDGFEVLKDKIDYPDGVMLRHPLNGLVDTEAGIRNSEFYEKWLIDDPSPMALSSMFIGNMEAEHFEPSFKRWNQLNQFSNNTFKIWTNYSNDWVGSYLPAAASYLDAIIFGLFGLRIREKGLYLKPKLTKNISFMQLCSISYLGSKIKVTVDSNDKGISLELMSKKINAPILWVMHAYKNKPIILNDRVFFPLNSYLVIKKMK